MRPTLSERKGELLIRSAESRLGAVESLGSAFAETERAWAHLASPSTYAKSGLIAGCGVLGVLLLRRLLSSSSKSPAPEVRAVGAASGSSLKYLAMQALTILVFPWLRSRLINGNWGDALKRLQPSHIIARWLGLES